MIHSAGYAEKVSLALKVLIQSATGWYKEGITSSIGSDTESHRVVQRRYRAGKDYLYWPVTLSDGRAMKGKDE